MIVKATNGAEVLIDDEDFHFVKGRTLTIDVRGYVRVSGNSRLLGKIPGSDSRGRIRLSRLLMNPGPNELVDHKFGNLLDNRRSYSLRNVTYSQNSQNQQVRRNTKKSKYKGVYSQDNVTNPWRARINTISIGNYKTELEAAIAYNIKAIELFGEYARLNIIEEVLND